MFRSEWSLLDVEQSKYQRHSLWVFHTVSVSGATPRYIKRRIKVITGNYFSIKALTKKKQLIVKSVHFCLFLITLGMESLLKESVISSWLEGKGISKENQNWSFLVACSSSRQKYKFGTSCKVSYMIYVRCKTWTDLKN